MDEKKNERRHQISGCENGGDIYDVQNVEYGSMHRQMGKKAAATTTTQTNRISRLNAIYRSAIGLFR